MYDKFITPFEMAIKIASSAKEKRLSLNMTQQNLSQRSGVSLSVLKKFETTGKISLESLLKLALVLDSLGEFLEVFKAKKTESFKTLDELIKQKTRKRGRK